MSKLTTCLWFDGQAEQAAEFYTSLFPNSSIDGIERSPGDYPSGREGDVITVEFTLDGDHFLGLNGGPDFRFNESISLMIDCRDQDEVDRYWDVLTRDGGEPGQCGWLKDRFGLSWQVVPRRLNELLHRGTDPDASRRAFEAMLEMGRIEIAKLEEAYGSPGQPEVGAGTR
ncbi:MAG TPA: VOC family protein [Candidatus Limnocylindrales bacterium]|nr:VOC family protein [Candidatus Limnocylindrales bacterium]